MTNDPLPPDLEPAKPPANVLPGCLLVLGVVAVILTALVAIVLALVQRTSRAEEGSPGASPPAEATLEQEGGLGQESRFDPQVWVAAEDKSVRGPMVAPLLREHLQTGVSRKEVLELLGAPDERIRIARMPNTTFAWSLGKTKGFFGERETKLVVEFDVSDRVTRAYID